MEGGDEDMARQINLAAEYNEFPFGRYPEHGPYNGQRFRDEQLAPALRAGESLEIDLSGARGLAPSFLEEAFGGLIRLGFDLDDLLQRIRVFSRVDPSLEAEVRAYMTDAARRATTH
jgi:hypothetical protein